MKLAFYHGPREGKWKLVSFLIRWRTRGKYDHVEVIFSDGRTASASISHGGIKFIEDKKYVTEHWDIVDVSDSEKNSIKWFSNHQNSKFDLWGVLGFLLGFTKGNDDRWFCSEAVAASLGYIEPWRFDPNTLYTVVKSKQH